MLWLWILLGALGLLAIYDLVQKKHSILRNFPVIGHLRYLLIEIGPELRQYIVAHNREETPFNRLEREWIYQSASRKNNYFAFGTDDHIYNIGYPIIKHAVFGCRSRAAKEGNKADHHVEIPCAKVIGEAHGRRSPYRPPSIINISAMSFGSLGSHAITALNLGAKHANCFHNTGEGGVARYHRHGADLCFQLGTGYFGARDADGKFDLERLVDLCASTPEIKMIEVKLSQGAKPGKGGVLPASKVTAEIAEARGVTEGHDVISPSTHSAFGDVGELIDFVETIADRTGLPVGIKAAIGRLDAWYDLADRMQRSGKGPDFIAIDGGEGGTGAAPLTFQDHVALPFKVAFSRVYEIFLERDLTDDIVWIASGKLGFPDRLIVAMAMGADLINVAREAMFSVGCIQAMKCHTDKCPSGVATHNKWLQRGLVPELQAKRFAGYMEAFRGEVMGVTYAAGYDHPGQFTPHDVEVSAGPNIFKTLFDIFGYETKQYEPGKPPKVQEKKETSDEPKEPDPEPKAGTATAPE